MAWLIVGVAAVFITISRWPFGALFMLIACSAMPRFYVELFGWNARPEHIAAAVVALAVGGWLLRWRRAWPLETLDYWIVAYVVANYVSSAFGSSAPSATLRWALQNNLAVLPYFLIRFLVRDLKTLRNVLLIFLFVGLAESIYGILCYMSFQLFTTKAGMEIGQYLVDVAAPYGSMYEPNLFGAYTGACAVLFLSLYLGSGPRRFGSLAGFLLASLATVLSYSRAALVGLLFAACLVLWRADQTKNGQRGKAKRSKAVILVLVGCFVLAISVTPVGRVIQERISQLYYEGLTEETTISRFLVIREALLAVPEHPLLGSGTASFNLSFDWAMYIPEWTSDKTWIGNAPIRILHDTGAVGLAVFMGFVVSLWLRIRRGLNSQAPMLLGLSAGALFYGISFQSTDGTILAFTWIHLGFLASAAILTDGVGQVPNGIQGMRREPA